MQRTLLTLLFLIWTTNGSVFGDVYRIREGDTLLIAVIGQPEYTQTVQVREDGMMSYFSGDLQVAGKTADAVSQRIRDFLVSGNLVSNPVIMVSPVPQENGIFVGGAVKTPGRYVISPKTDIGLYRAITLAGGMVENADVRQVQLIRANARLQTAPTAKKGTARLQTAPTAETETAQVKTAPTAETETAQVKTAPTAETETAQVKTAPTAKKGTARLQTAPTEKGTARLQTAPTAKKGTARLQTAPTAKKGTAQPETAPTAKKGTAQPETAPTAETETAQVKTEPTAETETAQVKTAPTAETETAQVKTEPTAEKGTARLQTAPTEKGTARLQTAPTVKKETAQVKTAPTEGKIETYDLSINQPYREVRVNVRDLVFVMPLSVIEVQGQVQVPGKLFIRGEIGIAEALARAGGLTAEADLGALVKVSRDGVLSEFSVSEQFWRTQPNPDANIGNGRSHLLSDGDVLFVPNAFKLEPIYVIGYVRNPGAHRVRGPLTLSQAVAVAGGFEEAADRKNVTIHQGDGTSLEHPFTSGTGTEALLYPGDILEVDKRFQLSWGMVSAIVSTASVLTTLLVTLIP